MSATRRVLTQKKLGQQIAYQPWSRLALDWADPLTQDIVFCTYMCAADCVNKALADYVSRRIGTMSSASTVAALNGSQAISYNGSSTSGLFPLDLSPWRRTTWTYRLAIPAGIGNKVIFEYPNDYNSKNGMVVYTDTATSTLGFAVSNHAGASNTYQVKTMPFPTANTMHTFSLQIDRDDTGTNAIYGVYMDGKPVALTLGTNSYGGLPFDNTAALYFGSRGGASLFFTGQMQTVMIHRRILRYDEIVRLHRNPYRILARAPYAFAGANMLGGFKPWRPLMNQVPTF